MAETDPFPRAGLWPAWREVLAILITAIALCALVDALLFRTRFYARLLDPHSSTGRLEHTLATETGHELWAKGVLILGDSIMEQGFSARLANWSQAARGYQFSNAAIPGSRERCWYYLLRDLDPKRNRYAVVVIPVESYDDRDLHEDDPADKIIDARYLAARLRLADVPQFAASFRSFDRRLEALRGAVLKGLVYRQDLQAFLDHPGSRIADVKTSRRIADWDAYLYDGIDRSLSGLRVDWRMRLISFPEGLSNYDKQILQDGIFEPLPPQQGYLAEYRQRWLRPIVDRYRGTATRILFLRPPTNAIPRKDLATESTGSIIRELALRPGVFLLPEHAFDDLEKPEYFYDLHHLNAEGRVRFTMQFVRSFAQCLPVQSTNLRPPGAN